MQLIMTRVPINLMNELNFMNNNNKTIIYQNSPSSKFPISSGGGFCIINETTIKVLEDFINMVNM